MWNIEPKATKKQRLKDIVVTRGPAGKGWEKWEGAKHLVMGREPTLGNEHTTQHTDDAL